MKPAISTTLMTTIQSQTNGIVSEMYHGKLGGGADLEWENAKKESAIETKLRIEEARQDCLASYKSKFGMEQAKADYAKSKTKEQQAAREQKLDAIDLARERYSEKSGLYKLFHRRLSGKKAEKMTTEQINNLYGGQK